MADIVHLIRHGQSTFNVHWEAHHTDPMHIDARLTDIGLDQARSLKPTVQDWRVEGVVVSPLTRALQTAEALFDSETPREVTALHREYAWSSCDVGRSPALLAQEFPAYRFDHLDDPWWWCPDGDRSQVHKEPPELVMRRIYSFHEYLRDRPERRLAVVGHGTFFWLFTGRRMENCEVITLDPHRHVVPDRPPDPENE